MWQLVVLPVAGIMVIALILFLIYGTTLAALAKALSRRLRDITSAFKETDKDE
jgi:hypothetical protein